MTRVVLHLHRDGGATPLDGITVDVVREVGLLRLRYQATGDIDAVRMPEPASPARVDELWKHTCFEVFLRSPQGDAYWEVNLAPSSQWAVYAFSGYRERIPDPVLAEPAITVVANLQTLTLRADLDLSTVVGLDPAAAWSLGLSAVIEDKAGERSYWALAHPPGKPDFHHASAFTLHLPPPDRP